MKYVLGFMFSEDLKHVLLIRKNRPSSLAGGLNGLGGKIEVGETPHEAMVREFDEECGVAYKEWIDIGRMDSIRDDDTIFIFKAVSDKLYNAFSKTDEEVSHHKVKTMSIENLNPLDHVIPLIHLCLDKKVQNVSITCSSL